MRGVNDFTLSNGKKLCQTKCEGGLGLRSMQGMDNVFVMKLGRGILNDKCSLWARILRAKYVKSHVQDQQLHSRNTRFGRQFPKCCLKSLQAQAGPLGMERKSGSGKKFGLKASVNYYSMWHKNLP